VISSIGASLGTASRSPRPSACVAMAREAIGASMRRPMNQASPSAIPSARATPVAVSAKVRHAPRFTVVAGMAIPSTQPLSCEVTYGV
jgi:hypothetical protein